MHACNAFTMSQMALKAPLNKKNLPPMQKWPLHNAIVEMLTVISSCYNVGINTHGNFIFENKNELDVEYWNSIDGFIVLINEQV
jgi:hypothetical protein